MVDKFDLHILLHSISEDIHSLHSKSIPWYKVIYVEHDSSSHIVPNTLISMFYNSVVFCSSRTHLDHVLVSLFLYSYQGSHA